MIVFFGSTKLISLQAKEQPREFVFESINKDEYTTLVPEKKEKAP
jgi:hypothetical protein